MSPNKDMQQPIVINEDALNLSLDHDDEMMEEVDQKKVPLDEQDLNTLQANIQQFADPSKARIRRRLMITKIVTMNFKSYYGRQVIGPFNKVRFI